MVDPKLEDIYLRELGDEFLQLEPECLGIAFFHPEKDLLV